MTIKEESKLLSNYNVFLIWCLLNCILILYAISIIIIKCLNNKFNNKVKSPIIIENTETCIGEKDKTNRNKNSDNIINYTNEEININISCNIKSPQKSKLNLYNRNTNYL